MEKIKTKAPVIFLCLIIFISLLNYTYLFFSNKQSYNSDEIWSYALSNSYYCPFLDFTGNEESMPNFETWITGKTFHDYITVQKGEQFTYDSVWFNQSKDVHPPFYYAILHSICSFFPDTFSPWFALFINYISFIAIMILLYQIGKKWFSAAFSLVLCAFYALSCGAEDTFTFLRMYAFCAFLALLLFYETEQYLTTPKKSTLLSLFLCMTVSSLTHYYLILFAFFITVFAEIYFLCKNRRKDFLLFGFTMLSGVLTAILIFPPMITQSFSNGNAFSNGSLPIYTQAKFIISLLTQQFMGFSVSLYHGLFFLYTGTILIFCLLILFILFFLLRKENFAARFFQKTKTLMIKLKNFIRKIVRSFSPSQGILFLTLLCLYIFCTFHLPAAVMKQGTIRYLFPFYPLICLFVLSLLNKLLTFRNHKIKCSLGIILLLLFSFLSNAFSTHVFFYDQNEICGKKISDLPSDSGFILLTRSSWNISDFSIQLQHAKYVYAISKKEYETPSLPDTLSALPSSEAPENMYLLFTESDYEGLNATDEKWLSLFQQLPYVNQMTFIGKDIVNGQSVLIYNLQSL